MSTERGAGGSGQPGAAEMEILLRRVERERQARKQAEQLLEHKSRELYEANQQLQAQAARLELTVQERTRALEEALEAMQDALRAKGEFLAVVSHEIRTPMNGVLGMAQLLQLTELNEEQRRYCDTIQTSGETLLAIINDILDMSKMDSGKVRLDVRPLQARQVAREVADLLGAQAQSKSLYLDIEVAGEVPEWVYGDATRLKQILTNLVGNALKFTQHGGVQVAMKMVQDGKVLECQVRDTGIGIPPDKVHRLFERFSQVDSSIGRRYGGTGLGLVISKHLVEAMGGDIGAESRQHQGSIFTFRLPVSAAPAPTDLAPAQLRAVKLPTALRILLVEDNTVNQMLAMGMLQKLGCPADLARDGEEALEKVRRVDYDLVLMDMQMPKMDGLTATRAIRAMSLRNQPQIVALTANAMESDRQLCLSAGMNDFLAKPFKIGELQEKIVAAAARGRSVTEKA
jgi:signal transduction histidine kinase/ActR/RegA family two-component response regulator